MSIFCQQRSKPRERIATVACGLFAILLWVAGVNAEPYRPANPETVLLRLPGGSVSVSETARAPSAALARARHEMDQGRLTLDERHFGRARALLANALPCVSRDGALLAFERCGNDLMTAALLIAYADVLQHAHEFGNAERALDRVLRLDPASEQARVLRASIRLARGHPREALQDCGALIRADALVTTACIAQAISLTGRLAEAHRLLSAELSRTSASGDRAAWAFGILAELSERLGRYEDAVVAIEHALSAAPSDPVLRIQAADLMLRSGKPERVPQILERLPRVEAVLLRRALAAKRVGAANADVLAREWRMSVARNVRLGRPVHLRDSAIAALHLDERASEALGYARANWSESKEIEDARILIAAAIAARQAQAASPVLQWIDALEIEDAAIQRARTRASL